MVWELDCQVGRMRRYSGIFKRWESGVLWWYIYLNFRTAEAEAGGLGVPG